MCAAPVHVDGKRGRAEVAVAIRAWEEAWAAAHVGPPGPGAEVLVLPESRVRKRGAAEKCCCSFEVALFTPPKPFAQSFLPFS